MTWKEKTRTRSQAFTTVGVPTVYKCSVVAYLLTCPSNPSAVMKMLTRTVKKTKTVATLFILFNLACFLTSFRSYFTADTGSHNSTNKVRYREG